MQNNSLKTSRRPLAVALSAVTLLAACASGPKPNAALDQARSAYSSASTNPQVVGSAPAELRQAQEALQRAEAAQRDKDEATVNHYAYLANQRIATAQETARLAQAEQTAAQSSQAREQILLAARTREAEMQRQQADQAQRAADAARRQAAAESDRARQLQQQLAEMNAKQTQRGLVLTLGDVLFDTGKATLKPGAMQTVDRLAAFLKENPQRAVQIDGYTDSTGSDTLNQTLSEQRANAVKTALMDRGVPADHVQARGLGESNPVASNDTAAGRQQNRRIEVVVANANS